jgi:hypothetical protein
MDRSYGDGLTVVAIFVKRHLAGVDRRVRRLRIAANIRSFPYGKGNCEMV